MNLLQWSRIILGTLALLIGGSAYSKATLLSTDFDVRNHGKRYIVKYKDSKRAKGALKNARAKIARELASHKATAAYIPEQALEALRKNPAISYIEEDVKRIPFAETSPYGISMVQADQLNDGFSNEITACIIDSGYYLNHTDLQVQNVTASPDPGTGDPFTDGSAHGTHVAGTIAALANGDGVVGINPSGALNIHIVKVFGDSGNWTYSSDLIAALDACERDRLEGTHLVINMSLGGSRKSRTEEVAFAQAYQRGVLSIAAAGNDGNTRKSYPASYDSVVSVAAIDENQNIASFSQQNDQVELAAPGVSVLSTTPYLSEQTLAVGADTFTGTKIEYAKDGQVTGELIDGGLCNQDNGDFLGRVVICQRGEVSFYEKVSHAETSGALGVVIYNNEPGLFSGTLGDGQSSSIPAIGVSMEDGEAILAAYLGVTGELSSLFSEPASGYDYFNGTSMATPHVTGVAALVWGLFPDKTAADIREALQASALDLGVAGRDQAFGFGLVQAKAAADYLGTIPAPPPPPEPGLEIVVSSDKEIYYVNDGDQFASIEVVVSDETGAKVSATLVPTPSVTFEEVAQGTYTALVDLSSYPEGPHSIAVTAIDDRGLSVDGEVNFEVSTRSIPGMKVAAIEYVGSGGRDGLKNLTIRLKVTDLSNVPLEGVQMSVAVDLDGALFGTGSATTGSDGYVGFTIKNAPSGCYSTVVTSLVKSGFVWVSDQDVTDAGLCK